jgi:hypothetical protein
MSFKKPTKLLSTINAKTVKGEKYGYVTYIMYLSPFTDNSKGINLCPHASDGCAKACLFGSGAARFDKVQNGKRNKTEYFLADRTAFLAQLDDEVTKAEKKHEGTDLIPVFRLNGTSDIVWEKFKIRDNKNIFELHPNVQFYDYTKNPIRMRKELPSNYHLTFSMSENNKDVTMELLSEGKNVAIVFGVRDENNLPNSYHGYKVINGDESDLRFKDEPNVIVGLKYKMLTGKGTAGVNKNNLETNDFIIRVDEIENIKNVA